MNDIALPPLPVEVRQDEISRICALVEREPYDCERGKDGRYPERTEALIREETAKYGRPRVSCACRPRRIEALGGGRLVVHQALVGHGLPPLPLETTFDVLVADAVGDADEVREFARSLPTRAGQTVDLRGLGHPMCLDTLNPVQAWMLRELKTANGAVGRAAVGAGKSGMYLLAPLAIPCRTAILLIKSSQRLHYRVEYLKVREHFRTPSVVFEDKLGKSSYITAGAPVLRLQAYSFISNKKNSTYLDTFDDLDLLLADESHLLANRVSSRGIRFLRLLARRGNVVFVPSSGSFVNHGIGDAAHLFAHALGMNSPYPIPPDAVEAFADVIDPVPCQDTTSTTARRLRKAFGDPTLPTSGPGALLLGNDDIRQGFARRSERTLGVITTRGSSAPCSIEINLREAPPMPDEVKEALADLRQRWLRPDGEEFVEVLEQAACLRELVFGYYNRFTFPHGEPVELIDEWFAARKPYFRQLRQKVQLGEPLLDSPSLCEDAAIRGWMEPRYDGPLPVWPVESWPAWARVKDRVKPVSKTAWIGDKPGHKRDDATHPGYFIARDAAKWARENIGIVWCQGVALGRLIARLAGIAYHGGGPNAEAKILGHMPAEDGVMEKGQRSIVASFDSHHESRNGLQFMFYKNLVVEIPSSSKGFEQLIGRTCRPGQQADTVTFDIYAHVYELMDAFRGAYRDAEFVETTATNRQMILAADIDPRLRIED